MWHGTVVIRPSRLAVVLSCHTPHALLRMFARSALAESAIYQFVRCFLSCVVPAVGRLHSRWLFFPSEDVLPGEGTLNISAEGCLLTCNQVLFVSLSGWLVPSGLIHRHHCCGCSVQQGESSNLSEMDPILSYRTFAFGCETCFPKENMGQSYEWFGYRSLLTSSPPCEGSEIKPSDNLHSSIVVSFSPLRT